MAIIKIINKNSTRYKKGDKHIKYMELVRNKRVKVNNKIKYQM
jgi:hypothetical protein